MMNSQGVIKLLTLSSARVAVHVLRSGKERAVQVVKTFVADLILALTFFRVRVIVSSPPIVAVWVLRVDTSI
jgi:hypothetical protein